MNFIQTSIEEPNKYIPRNCDNQQAEGIKKYQRLSILHSGLDYNFVKKAAGYTAVPCITAYNSWCSQYTANTQLHNSAIYSSTKHTCTFMHLEK